MRRVGGRRQAAGGAASRPGPTGAVPNRKRGMLGARRELRRADAEPAASLAEAQAFQPFAAPCHPSRRMEHSGPGVSTPGRPFRAPAGADTGDVSLAAEGDRRAFERLYRVHVARIHSLARRMVNGEEAGEITQDVFVRAWEKLGTFRGEAAFGTWLYRLAVNVILARRSKLAVQRARHLPDDEALETAPARPASTDLGMDLEGAIERLPVGARQVFVLHDVEGHKHEEIAGMLGVTTGTSKAQLHRARLLLRRHLNR